MKRHQPETRAQQGQPVAHTHHEFDAAARPAHGKRPAAAPPAAGDDPQELLAAAGYLGVIFFSFAPALVIYLVRGRSSDYLRRHAARAVNLSVGVILFDLSAGIA